MHYLALHFTLNLGKTPHAPEFGIIWHVVLFQQKEKRFLSIWIRDDQKKKVLQL